MEKRLLFSGGNCEKNPLILFKSALYCLNFHHKYIITANSGGDSHPLLASDICLF